MCGNDSFCFSAWKKWHLGGGFKDLFKRKWIPKELGWRWCPNFSCWYFSCISLLKKQPPPNLKVTPRILDLGGHFFSVNVRNPQLSCSSWSSQFSMTFWCWDDVFPIDLEPENQPVFFFLKWMFGGETCLAFFLRKMLAIRFQREMYSCQT